MAKSRYTVTGPNEVLGHQPGESFSAELPPEQEASLIESGNLKLGADDGEPPEKVACPACVEQELSRPPKFDDLNELQKHYADKHQGLVPPDSLAEATEKEE